MALGKQLREARERLGLSASEVAQATRMKVQTVEAIEREDFARIAAPIYGKGFIKLYAERVGLDPRALIDEFMHKVGAAKTPMLDGDGPAKRTPGTHAPTVPDDGQVRVVGREEPQQTPPATEEAPSTATGRKTRQKPAPAPLDELELFAQARARDSRREPPPAEARPEPKPVAPPPPPAPKPAPVVAAAAPVAPKPAPAIVAPPPPKPPEPAPQRVEAAPASAQAASTSEPAPDGWFHALDRWVSSLQLWQSPVRAVSVVVGVALILLLLISTVSRCATPRKPVNHPARPAPRVVVQPPEPYIE
jgi:hypothetical protein